MSVISRRELVTSGTAALAASLLPVSAEGASADRIPPLRQLLNRGEPEMYSGAELRYIGMPIGGLFAGTVYLGGDGQLWNWDIFNQGHYGCVDRGPTIFMGDKLEAGSGSNYVDPVRPQSPFKQAWQILVDGKPARFGDIRFRGEYPVGRVMFREADADIELTLEAFSPFVPLNVDDSSFPATTLTFRVKNIGQQPHRVRILYSAENPALIYSKTGKRSGGKTSDDGFWLGADTASPAPDAGTFAAVFADPPESRGGSEVKSGADHGEVFREFDLDPGQTVERTLVVAWHFPNCAKALPGKRNWYAKRWADAAAVAQDLIARWPALQATTRAWNRVWYDSTLPHWFLDRTFLNTSILATTTCHRLDEGRFYFWEGIGCCAGTCTHVYGYAQAIGRIFPEVERYLRAHIDFGIAYHADTGAIDYRAEYGKDVAVDGQASCILRAYREHQMSPSIDFLRGIWPQVKGAMENLIRRDAHRQGVLEGAQYNTLDTAWYGEIAWISSLYVGALRAAEAMAVDMGDAAFATECGGLADRGRAKIAADLFNGEYFIHRVDPAHPESNNTNVGCHIDQIYGQSWAMQVNLPRIVPERLAKTALRSLFKYNFYEDVWEYRRHMKAIPGGRWYATPKEAGLIMCSFPKGGAANAVGKGGDAWAVGYFNECMTGFEYQVANHMIAEGLLEEGLKIVYAIHRRYHPSKRNPYNEIECSDHYGRAMASYGAFVSMCGFVNDGPRHTMAFHPKLKGHFRCAFVNERGWGTFDRSSDGTETITYAYPTA